MTHPSQTTPAAMRDDTIISVRSARKYFPVQEGWLRTIKGYVKAVDDITFDIKKGETFGLVGESGSGKTTMGRAIMRLYDPTAGEMLYRKADGNVVDLARIEGAALKEARRELRMVFQDPFGSLNPRMTVGQIIEEGLVVNGLGKTKGERLGRVREALSSAGLPTDILSRFPHEFSGGQRQRIAIARAIAVEPEFILLDEPTSALDLSVQAQIIDLLRKLQTERGLSYLFISHDLKVVRALCHRVIVMQHGNIAEEGLVEDVLSNPKTEYTSKLVRAAFEVAA